MEKYLIDILTGVIENLLKKAVNLPTDEDLEKWEKHAKINGTLFDNWILELVKRARN